MTLFWRYSEPKEFSDCVACGDYPYIIADAASPNEPWGVAETRKVAELWAAAPELLHSLKSVVSLVELVCDSGRMEQRHEYAWRELLDCVRYVIEKAEGHSK